MAQDDGESLCRDGHYTKPFYLARASHNADYKVRTKDFTAYGSFPVIFTTS